MTQSTKPSYRNMARLSRSLLQSIVILVLLVVLPAPLYAGAPLQMVTETIERLASILEAPLGPDGSGVSQQRAMLRRAMKLRFDFSAMARISLGSYWEQLASRQHEFVGVFSDYMENAYLAKIESLKDTKVVYVRERVGGGLAQVDTKVVAPGGEDIPVNYRLHLVEGEWKIFDVLIGNVSVVENYRAQFHRILKVASFDSLLHRLQEKVAERDG